MESVDEEKNNTASTGLWKCQQIENFPKVVEIRKK